MKKTILSTAIFAAFVAGSISTATAQIAEGSVSGADFTTATWVNGSSDSVGSWYMSIGENGTTDISDSNLNNRTSIGSQSFFVNGGIDASGNATYTDVFRPLGGSLAATQSISLSASYLWDGGQRGIEFTESGGAGGLFRIEHINIGGNNTLQLAGNGLGADTLISSDAFEKAYTFTVGYVDAATVSFLATEYGSTTPLLSTNVTVAAMPNEIKFYVGGSTDTVNDYSNYGLFFNDLTTVPEPSTYALLGLGAVALGGHLLRRRRRVS